jgi:coenzyme F420-reducing hydrogenase beta subunit
LLFKRYTDWLGKKYKGKALSVDFRSKDKGGWDKYKIKIEINTRTKSIYRDRALDPYVSRFLEGKTLRESCYKCVHTKPHSMADLTIGDYWGIEVQHPEFFDKRGVSAVVVNTEKGERIFEKLKSEFTITNTALNKIMSQNPRLYIPIARPAVRDCIYDNIKDESIDIFEARELKVRINITRLVKLIMPPKLKALLKRFLTVGMFC